MFFKKLLSFICAIAVSFSAFSTNMFNKMSVLPDLVRVGIDYITLNRNTTVSKSEVLDKVNLAVNGEITQNSHPFVLATSEEFEKAKAEYESNDFTDYTGELWQYVFENANALLNLNNYPLNEYKLDEEDSILPISRETINRVVILSFAYKISGDEKYADRAILEMENACSYPDWCTGHFLATAEMALAVAIGYDWLYDYLTTEQKTQFCDKTWEYAIEPALSKNYLKNWFTWSKNNWNSICYSGIGIAAIVFANKNPQKAAEFLTMCYKNMPIAYENFTPSGVYAEGPGYCQSGMNSIVYFVATSLNAYGTDFGLSDIAGFKELGFFPVYITTPTGVFNFGDNKNRMCFTPVLHWYADKYSSALLSAYQMWDMPGKFEVNLSDVTEKNGEGRENALSLLWYNRAYDENSSFSQEPLCAYLLSDAGEDLALMRTGWLDKNATFAAIKGGYNYNNHGDLDIGTFVYDALGERWAEELGPGSYDAPDYFVNLPLAGRWKNYCKRAEGQNTLLINPSLTKDDQYPMARCNISSFSKTETGAQCRIDMTDAYKMNYASSVVRHFELDNDNLLIEDEIECKIRSEIYWLMHTKADIEIINDGKTAILTKNGKQVRVDSLSDGVFTVMKSEKLTGKYEYDEDYADINKLAIKLEKVKSASFKIEIKPLGES